MPIQVQSNEVRKRLWLKLLSHTAAVHTLMYMWLCMCTLSCVHCRWNVNRSFSSSSVNRSLPPSGEKQWNLTNPPATSPCMNAYIHTLTHGAYFTYKYIHTAWWLKQIQLFIPYKGLVRICEPQVAPKEPLKSFFWGGIMGLTPDFLSREALEGKCFYSIAV